MDIRPDNVERFHNMGLGIHTLIKIKHIQPFNGPIVVEAQGRLIALRKREIECLTLK
jgi:Fe2+ transport system protein FeoA